TRMQAELARLAPGVLLTNGVKAHGLGALLRPALGCPLVWYAREGLEDRTISRVGLRALGRRCDGVLAISRYVAGEMRPLVAGPGAAPRRREQRGRRARAPGPAAAAGPDQAAGRGLARHRRRAHAAEGAGPVPRGRCARRGGRAARAVPRRRR